MKAPQRGWHFPRVIAHRGGGTLAPENTLAAMRLARDRGFKAVEFDAMLSSDLVPVLMHDPRFGRTVPGAGAVADTTAARLAQMDAGSWLSDQFRGEPVPMLADIIRWLHQHDVWMNIEIKPAPGHEAETGRVVGEVTQAVWQELEASSGVGRLAPVFSSFSDRALQAAREAAPDVGRAMLWKQVPADWEARLMQLDCIAVHCNHGYLTREQAAGIKRAGYGLMCYTVNDAERARELRTWGVDAICTDRLDLFSPDQF
nr:glycerophosphodiester phosphodiesterase [Pseudomonas sp.]